MYKPRWIFIALHQFKGFTHLQFTAWKIHFARKSLTSDACKVIFDDFIPASVLNFANLESEVQYCQLKYDLTWKSRYYFHLAWHYWKQKRFKAENTIQILIVPWIIHITAVHCSNHFFDQRNEIRARVSNLCDLLCYINICNVFVGLFMCQPWQCVVWEQNANFTFSWSVLWKFAASCTGT